MLTQHPHPPHLNPLQPTRRHCPHPRRLPRLLRQEKHIRLIPHIIQTDCRRNHRDLVLGPFDDHIPEGLDVFAPGGHFGVVYKLGGEG